MSKIYFVIVISIFSMISSGGYLIASSNMGLEENLIIGFVQFIASIIFLSVSLLYVFNKNLSSLKILMYLLMALTAIIFLGGIIALVELNFPKVLGFLLFGLILTWLLKLIKNDLREKTQVQDPQSD